MGYALPRSWRSGLGVRRGRHWRQFPLFLSSSEPYSYANYGDYADGGWLRYDRDCGEDGDKDEDGGDDNCSSFVGF